jgi:hypothetical protein
MLAAAPRRALPGRTAPPGKPGPPLKEMEKTMMEECFYCGEEASRADIDRLGKCPSCMEAMTRAAEAAARESQGPCYTIGPTAYKMY